MITVRNGTTGEVCCIDELVMNWGESYLGTFVRHSKRFTVSMTDSESSEFLQYIIEGFTE